MKKHRIPKSSLAGLLLLAALPQASRAATYYWDNNSIAAGFGTAGGTWGSSANWSTDDSGLVTTTAYTTTTSDGINFGAGVTGLGAGTVAITGTQNAGALTFASGSGAIVLSGGTAINLAAESTITVNNATNTISTPLTGAATSLLKTGAGSVILSGANSYLGTTIIGAGTLQVGDGSTGSLNGTSGTDLTFTGTSTLNVKEADTVNQGMGTLSFNYGEGTVINTFNTTASTLTFSGMNARSPGATGNFTISGGTANTNKIVLTNNANAPLSSSGSNDRGIFYNLYSLSTAASFARYDTTNLYFRGTDYSTPDSNATATASPYGSAVDLSLGNVNTTPAASVSLNTLRVLPTTNPRSFNVGNGNTLSINGILAALPSGGPGSTAVQFRVGTGTAGQGFLQPASGSEVVLAGVRADAFALTTSSLAIGHVIRDNGTATNVTFVGNATTVVQAANTYTGVTTINSGFVRALNWAPVGSASGLGTGGSLGAGAIVINGGTLNYGNVNLVNATTNRLFTIGAGGATLDNSGNSGTCGNWTIGSAGGAILFSRSDAPVTLTLANNAPAYTTTGLGTLGADLGNPGTGANVTSVIKTGAGTWQLAGNNSYTGNTTILSGGTLTLTSTGTLKFAPTTNDLCNKVTGPGTANFNGTFNIDLTNAAIANGNAWTLVDVTNKTYGGTFAVTGFTNSSGVWTKVDGDKTWTFTQSTGVLSLAVVSSGPTITLTGTLGAVNTTYGTASATPTSFTLAGSDLTGAPGNLTVTPPDGYEASYGSGYSNPLSVPYSSSTRSAITVSVRLAANAAVNGGAGYTGDITVEGGGASSQTIATVSSTVAPANLTLTASDQTKFFGTTQTTPVTGSTAFTSSGLMNGETVGTVTLDYSAGALDAGDLPGATSTITPSAATGGTFNPSNYNTIVYNTGRLTVLAVPTITLGGSLGAVDTTYGTPTAAPTSFTVSATDLLPASGNLTVTPPAGYEVSSGAGYSTSLLVPYTGSALSSTTVSVRLAATTAVNGGAPYSGDITIAGGGASSQTIATVSSTVAPANLTITANNQNKAYNTTQTSPVTGSAAFTSSGLMNGQTISDVTLTYGTGALDPSDAVGSTSTITPSTAAGTLNADNYNISYVPGTLTVIKATPTATLAVNNSPVTYNGSAQTSTVGITSSVAGTVQNIQIGGAADQTNAGTYAVTADFVPDDTTNYNTLSTQPAGNFVIDKADATVVVTPYTVDYDGTPKTATVTSITGVNGETGATVGTVTLTNTTHTNAGVYASDSWSFTGTANYNNIDSSISTIAVANGSFETTGQALGGPWFTFGSPWSITNSPSNFQVINAVAGGAFNSTAAGGGTHIGLINNDNCPITAPLTQNLGVSVTAGDTLTVTFQRGNPLISSGGAGVAYFDVDGTKYTMPFDTTGMTAGTWQLTTMTKTITNSGNLTLGFYGTTGNRINVWVDLVSNVSRTTADVQTLLTNTINKATPTATLAVNNSPVIYDGTPKAATVGVTASSVPGSAQNILTGGAATQTAAATYAVTADFVPTDTTNYNTLIGLSAGNFIIENNNTYSDWALANGVTGGVTGDSNNDGVQNGVAYFMGVTGQATNPSLNASNQVTWPVNPDYQGTFEVQISSDLSIWTPADPQPTPSAGNLIYTLPSGLGKQFVRLVVTPD
jgi:autotransporter-associated beta strand protein